MAKQTLLNFQQMRAEKSIDPPTVIDMDGKVHFVGAFPLDFFLEVLQLQSKFNEDLNTDELVALFERIKAMLVSVLPTFPVGRLDIQETQMLVLALVSSIQPDAVDDAPRDAEGELTPPVG